MTKTLTITIVGLDDSDLETGLEVVRDQVREGFTSGHDRNETGQYKFSISESADKVDESAELSTKAINVAVGNKIVDVPGGFDRIKEGHCDYIVRKISTYGSGRVRFEFNNDFYAAVAATDLVTIEPGNHLTPENHS